MRIPFPDRVLNQHIAVLGKTGAGKSSAMRVIAEHQLDRNRRVCIVDPKGDWWGLKSSADGKSAGYPVITFGDFKEPRATDIPINAQSGKHVAELIANGNRPCVIGFRGWMPGQMTKFWLDFAPTLFNANEGELYVIIDEVHNFAPKGKVMDPESGKMLHWTNRIMSEGRGLGLTFFIASQRPQKVHNDTLDNCETLVAMRIAHPASRNAVKEWIDGNGDRDKGKEVLDTLAKMKRGEAWVWSPENEFGPERVQFPMFSTFDSFAPPQLQKKVSQSGWSEVDLDQVKAKLAAVIAEVKANDPKELKATIAQLRKELAQRPTEQKIVTEEKTVEVKVFTDAQIKELRESIGEVERIANIFKAALDSVSKKNAPMQRFSQVERPIEIKLPYVAKEKQTQAFHEGNLSRPQQNILNQLAELEALGIKNPERAQLSLMAGYTNWRSGGFSEPLGYLIENGYVHVPSSGLVCLTPNGRLHANAVDAPLSSQELHDRLCRTLGGPEEKLLREILTSYPDSISKEELGGKLGYTNVRSGGFSEPVGRLKSLGIIEYPQSGFVKAADWLYIA